MTRHHLPITLAAAILMTAPALAHEPARDRAAADLALETEAQIVIRGDLLRPAPNNDSNPYWLDYRTDISEARRELESDLRRATDEEDRRDARAEYYREIRDAQKDYSKEMIERGYRVVSFEADADSELALWTRK